MSRNTLFLLSLFFLQACGQMPGSSEVSQNQNQSIKYTKTYEGRTVIWAYGADWGPLNGPTMNSGILVVNRTPDQPIDSSRARLEILRAANGRINSGSDSVRVLDYHPSLSEERLSYQLLSDRPVSVQRLSADQYKVYLNLYEAPPSYEARPGVATTRIPLGTINMARSAQFAYVTPESGYKLAAVTSGRDLGNWGIQIADDTPPSNQPEPNTWCETATVQAGALANQTPGFDQVECRPRPSELQECLTPSAGTSGCIGHAPVDEANPFEAVGLIDETFLNEYDRDHRVFTLHPQAPYQAKVNLTFRADSIASTPNNNAKQCADLFRATGWTIGAQINDHCKVTPAPSPDPADGKLACSVVFQFIHDQTSRDKNCYVSGIFTGEQRQMQQLLIYRE